MCGFIAQLAEHRTGIAEVTTYELFHTYVMSNYYSSRKPILSFIDQLNTLFAWRLGAADLIAVEILFFRICRWENLGELCVHFELQVGSPSPPIVR